MNWSINEHPHPAASYGTGTISEAQGSAAPMIYEAVARGLVELLRPLTSDDAVIITLGAPEYPAGPQCWHVRATLRNAPSRLFWVGLWDDHVTVVTNRQYFFEWCYPGMLDQIVAIFQEFVAQPGRQPGSLSPAQRDALGL